LEDIDDIPSLDLNNIPQTPASMASNTMQEPSDLPLANIQYRNESALPTTSTADDSSTIETSSTSGQTDGRLSSDTNNAHHEMEDSESEITQESHVRQDTQYQDTENHPSTSHNPDDCVEADDADHAMGTSLSMIFQSENIQVNESRPSSTPEQSDISQTRQDGSITISQSGSSNTFSPSSVNETLLTGQGQHGEVEVSEASKSSSQIPHERSIEQISLSADGSSNDSATTLDPSLSNTITLNLIESSNDAFPRDITTSDSNSLAIIPLSQSRFSLNEDLSDIVNIDSTRNDQRSLIATRTSRISLTFSTSNELDQLISSILDWLLGNSEEIRHCRAFENRGFIVVRTLQDLLFEMREALTTMYPCLTFWIGSNQVGVYDPLILERCSTARAEVLSLWRRGFGEYIFFSYTTIDPSPYLKSYLNFEKISG
jgi:hypothetical protein